VRLLLAFEWKRLLDVGEKRKQRGEKEERKEEERKEKGKDGDNGLQVKLLS
jgi:hypothetical protein